MTDPEPGETPTLFPKSAGERLREAREALGLSLAEVAARTRVPTRQLEAVELSNFGAMPSITYSVGFAKAYARAVGLDEVEIAREVRGQNDHIVQRTDYEAYASVDPSRVPSRGLALIGLAVAVLLLIGAGLWYGSTRWRGDDSQPAAAPTTASPRAAGATPPPPATAPAAATASPAAVPSTSQVTLTATGRVWLRVYEAGGKTLFEDTLNPGDHYDVPATATAPLIAIGRPDKLAVTVGGSVAASLGSGARAIKDVGISAAALAARGSAPPAAPTPSAGSASPTSAVTRPQQARPQSTPRHRDTAPGRTSAEPRISAKPSSGSPTAAPVPVPSASTPLNIAAPAARPPGRASDGAAPAPAPTP